MEFKNLIGNETTVTPIDKEGFQEGLRHMSVPFGVKIPSTWQPPEGFTLEKFEIEGVAVERISPVNGGNGKIILNFHGGAYTIALIDNGRIPSSLYAEKVPGSVVYNIDYRVAPTDPYPAALEDCITVYKWLLKEGHKGKDIVFTGESAGGGLELAVTHYLKDHQIELPKGILAISPWTDLTYTTPSRTLNIPNDIMLGEGGWELVINEVKNSSYIGTADPTHPYISPAFGDFTGFPKMLIQVGSFDIIYDDSVKVANKAEAAGVDVKISSYYGMTHCFQQFFYEIPESQMAWEEIVTFLNECFSC